MNLFHRLAKKRSQLGITIIELLMAVAMAGGTMLVLATVMTFTTFENERTRGQAEFLSELGLSFDLLNQYLAQTTQVFECNCGTDLNCLICNTPGGCAGTFPDPTTWQGTQTVPNPPTPLARGGICGAEDLVVQAQIRIQLGWTADFLQGRCLLHTEFEDLASYPKMPTGTVMPVLPFATNAMAGATWQEPPAPQTLLNGASTGPGMCNDYGQVSGGPSAAGTNNMYAAGCWKDLYVYYVPPVQEAVGVESTPGFMLFAITTTPARNGTVVFGGGRPLQLYTLGNPPNRPAQGPSAAGVAGVACGYVPAYSQSLDTLPGAVPPNNNLGGVPIVGPGALTSGYPTTSPARSLLFEFYALAKIRQSTAPLSNGAADYESWHAAGTNFFRGSFRQLFSRVNFHNLSEMGIHFLKLNSTRMALVYDGQSGRASGGRPTGCYLNGATAIPASRSSCCSNAITDAGMCVACVPSGSAPTGLNSCCSEQQPVGGLGGNCP